MSVLGSISVSMVGTTSSMLIHLIGTMIIARLLTPEELGVFSVAAAASTLLAAFKNFGTSNYLIQAPALGSSLVGSAFSATFLLSGILGSALFLLSDYLADFFANDSVATVLQILALNFAITPFVTIASALLVRRQRFKQLVLIEVISGFAAVAVSVLLAALGMGPLSLALGTTVHSLLMLALLVRARPPGLTYRPALRGVTRVLTFGSWSSGAILMNQLGTRSAEFIIGKTVSLSSAAMFDKGVSLPRMVGEQLLGPVLRVLLPVFAEDRRRELGYRDRYLEYLDVLGTVLGPVYIYLAFNAQHLIPLLYGDQWLPAIPLVSVIAVEYLLLSPSFLAEKVLIADGKVRRLFYLKTIQSVARILFILAGAYFGLLGAGMGLVFAAILYSVLIQWSVSRLLHLSLADLRVATTSPLAALGGALVAGIAATQVSASMGVSSGLLNLVFSAAIMAGTWLVLAFAFRFVALELLWTRAVITWRRHRDTAGQS